MNYFYKQGIRVPEDFSIAGYDNVSFGESALVPLTTVLQTPYQMGFTMDSRMIAEIEAKEDHVHQQVIFQPQIAERASATKNL